MQYQTSGIQLITKNSSIWCQVIRYIAIVLSDDAMSRPLIRSW